MHRRHGAQSCFFVPAVNGVKRVGWCDQNIWQVAARERDWRGRQQRWRDVWLVGRRETDRRRGDLDGDSDVAQQWMSRSYCRGVALDNEGHLLVASSDSIRAVARNGRATTLAKVGDFPTYVLAAPDGSTFVAKVGSIRKISTNGIVTMIPGDPEGLGRGLVDGTDPGYDIYGMALTASGTLIACDRSNNRLRRVDPNNEQVTTIDLPADLPIERPIGVSRSSDGTLYVAARNGVYEINNSNVSQLAHANFDDDKAQCCHLDETKGLLLHWHRVENIHYLGVDIGRVARRTHLSARADLGAGAAEPRNDCHSVAVQQKGGISFGVVARDAPPCCRRSGTCVCASPIRGWGSMRCAVVVVGLTRPQEVGVAQHGTRR